MILKSIIIESQIFKEIIVIKKLYYFFIKSISYQFKEVDIFELITN